MRILLTSKEPLLNASRISLQAAFAKRNVNEALLALADAGAVKARWSGNERLFGVDRAKWTQTLDIGPTADSMAGNAPWINILRSLTALHVWFENSLSDAWSPYLTASEAGSLTDSLSADLEPIGISTGRNGIVSGEMFWASFEKMVLELLDLAEGRQKNAAWASQGS